MACKYFENKLIQNMKICCSVESIKTDSELSLACMETAEPAKLDLLRPGQCGGFFIPANRWTTIFAGHLYNSGDHIRVYECVYSVQGVPKKYLQDCLNNISGYKHAKWLIHISFERWDL